MQLWNEVAFTDRCIIYLWDVFTRHRTNCPKPVPVQTLTRTKSLHSARLKADLACGAVAVSAAKNGSEWVRERQNNLSKEYLTHDYVSHQLRCARQKRADSSVGRSVLGRSTITKGFKVSQFNNMPISNFSYSPMYAPVLVSNLYLAAKITKATRSKLR